MENNKDTEVEMCLMELSSVCQTITITGLSQMVKVNFVDQLFVGIVGIANSTERFGGPFPSLDVFGLNRHDPNYGFCTAEIVDDCCGSYCQLQLIFMCFLSVGLCVDQLNLVWADIVSMTSPVLKRMAAEHFYTRNVSWYVSIRTCALEVLSPVYNLWTLTGTNCLLYVNSLFQKAAAILDNCCASPDLIASDIQTLTQYAEQSAMDQGILCHKLSADQQFLHQIGNLVEQQNTMMVNQINDMAKQDNLTEEQAKKLEDFSKMIGVYGIAFALVFKFFARGINEN